MKTLIINGSPRKSGDTVFLINELKKQISGEVKIVNTYYTEIKPCNDCRYCWEHDKCAMNDEMQVVFEYINTADNIIIASPIYFSELTGSLLNFASRLQYLYVSRNFRKIEALENKQRNGFVILVGGGDGKMDKALSTAKCLLSQMGAIYVDSAVSHNTNKIPASKDLATIKKIKQIAERTLGK